MTIFIKKKLKILDPLLWILFFQLFIFFGQFLICALQNPVLIFFVLQSIWFMFISMKKNITDKSLREVSV